MDRSERLRRVVDHLKYKLSLSNDAELSEKLGYKRSYLSQVINMKVNLSRKFLSALKEIDENINIDWIREGTGEMLNESINQENESEMTEKARLIKENLELKEELSRYKAIVDALTGRDSSMNQTGS